MPDELIDVVMRMHDARRLSELNRAVFSLVAQSYRPLRVNLCTQRFTRGMLLDVRDAIAPLLAMDDTIEVRFLNYEAALPVDSRSVLINMGLDAATGRYVAFLDYDDTVTGQGYALLIERLRDTGAAIAFGTITVKKVDFEDQIPFVQTRQRLWSGRTLLDQFADNFCPIHSFVFDRTGIPDTIRFEPELTRQEDYDFLLRICAGFRADFHLLDTVVGHYYVKSDGSNSILTESAFTDANRAEWRRADAFVEQRRRTTLVAPEVQHDTGLRTPIPGLTIRALMDRMNRRSPAAIA